MSDDKKKNVYKDISDDSLAYEVLNEYSNLSVSVRKKVTEMTKADTGEVVEFENFIVTIRSLEWNADARARVERSHYMKFNPEEFEKFKNILSNV